jgi:hypothetical protein
MEAYLCKAVWKFSIALLQLFLRDLRLCLHKQRNKHQTAFYIEDTLQNHRCENLKSYMLFI